MEMEESEGERERGSKSKIVNYKLKEKTPPVTKKYLEAAEFCNIRKLRPGKQSIRVCTCACVCLRNN